MVTPRRGDVSTLILNLAEPLVVRSVTSRKLGYLMALRVSGQEDVIINLPEPLRPDELLDLEIAYSGRLPASPPEREAVDLGQAQAGPYAQTSEIFTIQAQPSYIYTGRSRWYPQGESTDYATATMRLRVPENFSSIASGTLDEGYPKLVTSAGRTGRCAISAGPPADSCTSTARPSPSPRRKKMLRRSKAWPTPSAICTSHRAACCSAGRASSSRRGSA